jgi:broad specificity phosphatase PhoE
MTRFLLIRHGLTDAVDHYVAGVAPGTHLNETGRSQAAALAERLHDVAMTAVVSSPLERTRETAAPIARDHGLTVEVDASFIEYDAGAWTGRTFESLDDDQGWQRFNRVRSVTRAERGELMLTVQHRSVTALLALAERYRTGTVAVVSHGDTIRAMLLYVLGMPIDFYHRIEVSPARGIVEISRDDPPRVLQMNGQGGGVK